MSADPLARFTAEEYLERDRVAEHPTEYHDGEILETEAGTFNHGRLRGNLFGVLDELLAKTNCRPGQDVRVHPAKSRYIYPDLIVVCGKLESEDSHKDIVLNPKVVVEVTSPSTANYDYGGKFIMYRQIPSIREYLLVSQTEPMVDVFRREEGDTWQMQGIRGMDSVVAIECLGVTIPLERLYSEIGF